MFAIFVGNFGLLKGYCFTFQLNHVFQLYENSKPTVFVNSMIFDIQNSNCLLCLKKAPVYTGLKLTASIFGAGGGHS